MIKYDFFDNGKLLIVKYLEEISKSDLISFFRYCAERNYLSTIQIILADYRDAKEVYTIDDLIEITEERIKLEKGISEMNTVFLVDNPKTTAIAYLYSNYYKDHSWVNVCSTINCCINSLNLNVIISKDELVELLNNPGNEFIK